MLVEERSRLAVTLGHKLALVELLVKLSVEQRLFELVGPKVVESTFLEGHLLA